MKSFTFRGSITQALVLGCVVLLLFLAGGCSKAETVAVANTRPGQPAAPGEPANASGESKGPSISIDANGPADTVRAFYKLLRENKFREAMFLTNLRPAIESLTDSELKEFAIDFESIAGEVPAQVDINGEIITGDQATVTVKLPNNETGEIETQPIKLRKDGEVWFIATADEESSQLMKKEGKDYLFNLRIKVHEGEARKMLERISKSQLAYSLQHGGAYTDLAGLLAVGQLPEDAKDSASTGYNYAVDLAKGRYTATATPAVYGKTGKLSFLLYLDNKGMSHVKEKDNRGERLRQ